MQACLFIRWDNPTPLKASNFLFSTATTTTTTATASVTTSSSTSAAAAATIDQTVPTTWTKERKAAAAAAADGLASHVQASTAGNFTGNCHRISKDNEYASETRVLSRETRQINSRQTVRFTAEKQL